MSIESTLSGAAVARIEKRLRAAGSTQSGSDWLCPTHADKGRSLTVRQADAVAGAVLKCGAGCKTTDVLRALDLTERDLYDASPDTVVSEERYVYRDEEGKPLFRVTKKRLANGKKRFSQALANGKGGWLKPVRDKSGKVVARPMDGVRLVLWRLPTLAQAIADGDEIHLAEGEKDAKAITAASDVFANCHPMGAGKWQPTYTQSLAGAASVVVWADRDGPGYRCAHQRLSALLAAGIPATARLPIPDHKGADVSDHLAAGHSPADGKPVTLKELELLGTESSLGSWGPEDLTDILRGTFKPLMPTVGRREGDGLALFYPGKMHLLIAESEAGKTWLALYAAKQEMEDGHHVFFYDFEDDAASGVVGRLLDMDCERSAIEQFFHYIRPDESVNAELLEAVIARHLRAIRPTLVITDGVTEVMSQNGWGQSENNDIAGFYNMILKPMAREGAAVVALDHLPKYDEKGRGAIGGVHWLNGLDGAAYRLEADREIAPGRVGRTRIKHDKDRPGQVKRHAEGKNASPTSSWTPKGKDPCWCPCGHPTSTRSKETRRRPKPLRRSRPAARGWFAHLSGEWIQTSAVVRAVEGEYGAKAPSVSTTKRVLKDLSEAGVVEKRQETDDRNRKVDFWRLP